MADHSKIDAEAQQLLHDLEVLQGKIVTFDKAAKSLEWTREHVSEVSQNMDQCTERLSTISTMLEQLDKSSLVEMIGDVRAGLPQMQANVEVALQTLDGLRKALDGSFQRLNRTVESTSSQVMDQVRLNLESLQGATQTLATRIRSVELQLENATSEIARRQDALEKQVTDARKTTKRAAWLLFVFLLVGFGAVIALALREHIPFLSGL
jgi:chromosome segregation ATPase